MRSALYRSRTSFAQVSFEMVRALEGNVTLAAIFDWVAWKADESHDSVKADDGSSWYPVTYPELSATMGISEKVARSSLSRLVELGELRVCELKLKGPYDRTRSYAPVWEGADPLPHRADAPAPQGRSTSAPEGSSSSIEARKKSSLEVADATLRDDVREILEHLDAALKRNEVKKPARTKKNTDAARLLLDRDHRTVDQVKKAIDWATADPFWRSNILSMAKLREKYDQLRMQAQRDQQQHQSAPAYAGRREYEAPE